MKRRILTFLAFNNYSQFRLRILQFVIPANGGNLLARLRGFPPFAGMTNSKNCTRINRSDYSRYEFGDLLCSAI
jgi:hypothetical protein